MPHGVCYRWDPLLIGIHVVSDLLIVFAYYSIPVILTVIVLRSQGKIPYNWVFLQFSLFIMACGTTHLMEIINIWKAEYWLSGILKVITAIFSLLTAISLLPHVPKLIETLKEKPNT